MPLLPQSFLSQRGLEFNRVVVFMMQAERGMEFKRVVVFMMKWWDFRVIVQIIWRHK
jgi:hypothetical protein